MENLNTTKHLYHDENNALKYIITRINTSIQCEMPTGEFRLPKKKYLYNTVNYKSQDYVVIVDNEIEVDSIQKSFGDNIWATTWCSAGNSTAIINKDCFNFIKEKCFEKIFYAGAHASEIKIILNDIYISHCIYFYDSYSDFNHFIEALESDSYHYYEFKLQKTSSGKVVTNDLNLIEIFNHDPNFKGKILFDEHSHNVFYKQKNSTPIRISDALLLDIKLKLYSLYSFSKDLTTSHINECMQLSQHKVNFLRSKLFECKENWDGEARFDERIFRSLNEDFDFHNLKAFMWHATQRVLNPGYHCREVVVLVGPQDLNKSYFLEIIGMGYWTTNNTKMTERDFKINCMGKWIIELAELAALKGLSPEEVKSVISLKEDTLRLPHYTFSNDFKRNFIFVGTTNKEKYLTDFTGNTRFITINLISLDIDYVKKNVEQLWGEVLNMKNMSFKKENSDVNFDISELIKLCNKIIDKRGKIFVYEIEHYFGITMRYPQLFSAVKQLKEYGFDKCEDKATRRQVIMRTANESK